MLGTKTKIEVLIMAAGASRRLGQPKQLVKYKGQTLIRRIVQETLAAEIGNITVITGFNHDEVEKEIHDLKVDVFYNEEWDPDSAESCLDGFDSLQCEDTVDDEYAGRRRLARLWSEPCRNLCK